MRQWDGYDFPGLNTFDHQVDHGGPVLIALRQIVVIHIHIPNHVWPAILSFK